MLKQFNFNKNAKGEWYLALPEWKGDPEDLQMIQGADEWLDLLSKQGEKVTVNLSNEKFDDADYLTLIRLGEENLGGGGNYLLETYQNKKINLKIWICEVTEFIFDEYPQKLYFKVI